MKVEIKIDLVLPELPDEIQDTRGNTYSFVSLSNNQIEKLAKVWAKALIARNHD